MICIKAIFDKKYNEKIEKEKEREIESPQTFTMILYL